MDLQVNLTHMSVPRNYNGKQKSRHPRPNFMFYGIIDEYEPYIRIQPKFDDGEVQIDCKECAFTINQLKH